jgi:hypothetical protein
MTASRAQQDGWKYIHYHESRILDLELVTAALNEGGEAASRLAYGKALSQP